MERQLKNSIKVFNSMSWCANTIIIIVMFLLVQMWVLSLGPYADEDVWYAVLLPCSMFVCIIPVIIISRRGIMYAYIKEDCVEGRLLGRKKCRYEWKEIKNVVCFRSVNYNRELNSVYLLVSANHIPYKKNAALSYNCKTQILIKLTTKKSSEIIDFINSKLGLSITQEIINSAGYDEHTVIM